MEWAPGSWRLSYRPLNIWVQTTQPCGESLRCCYIGDKGYTLDLVPFESGNVIVVPLKSVWERMVRRADMKGTSADPRTDVAQVCAGFLDTSGERLFALADPNTRIVVLRPVLAGIGRLDSSGTHLLVWLVLALGVADLCHNIILLLEDEVLNYRLCHVRSYQQTTIDVP